KAYSENSSEEDIKAGRIPFNLDTAGFVHPNYPIVAKAVRNKETGSKVTTNIGGIQKVMAYAPILYSTGQYEKHGIFGGITIGAEFNQFQESTAKVASDLSDIIILLRNNITVFVLLTFVITVIGSWLFSKNLTDPILAITGDAKRIASGEDVQIGTIHRNDEIGVLSNTIGYMAQELKRSNEELKESLVSLQDSKSEIENYAKDLEYQITIFSTIQRISNILGSTTPMEKVLKEILRSCKESLRFDRTVLYLRDDNNKYLEYTENYGLSKEEERSAKNARYNIYDQDCIETRVLRTGEIIFVEDFKNYSEATEFDKRIYQSSKSDSFVYVPLKAKENIIGILGADRNHTKEKIKEIDINSLQIFANQASRIIENSQLYQEISEQRNFFENIIRFMIKGVVTIDVKGVITSINRTACEILHVERESVLGMEIVSYLENFQDFPELINKLITESITKADINEMRMNVNGKIISANITAIESEESDLAGYIVLLEDVTEKKRLDDHLHDLDRLASLGKFAAGIAHEIRNPLTGLSVFLDDLHDKLSSQVENSRFISLALSEIGRLERLVNELLDYATPHSAQMDYHDLNTLIESTLHFTEKQCRDAGIKVEVFYEKNLPKIHVDSGKIQQALLNMILNAIQAIGKNGKIRISTKISVESEFLSVFERGTRKISKWIKIIIEDSGSGISKELQSKIFEPFVTEKKGGTGLGLSITQSIISEHNGKIELADTDLQGASFIIYLPAIKER
ncbi:MAG: GAF domain-containing protein, partial [Calditrichaeota bacterium]